MKKLFRRLAAVFCVLALCLTPVSALTVEEALELLEANYVGELPAAAYEATTLDELFAIVGDPYTYYMSPTGYEEFAASVESETTVTGIGAGIEYTADGIRIASVLSGGGAEECGLRPGDYIIAAEGVSCVPADESHRGLIIGEAGTYVNITVRHADGSTQDYRIERRTITLHNTTVTYDGGVATINCDSFGSQTGTYFEEGIAKYGEDTELWIVDLRNNVGGYADAAVISLGVFTGYGPKLYYRLSDGNAFYTMYLAGSMTDKPVIALVNGWSASASEILSGGIRAEGAGIVVGTRTFGKGTAQIVLDSEKYPDLFSGDSLKVTAYRFYCSDGNTTDKIGVLPTLCVADEYTAAIAKLLLVEKPISGEFLRLTLNGRQFFVDPANAGSAEYGDAFIELLAALPPDAKLAFVTDGGAEPVSPLVMLKQYGGSSASRWFTDVADSPYADAVNTLATCGILQGDGAGHFRPDSTLTRAELCQMLAQALNVTSRAPSSFSDIADDDPCAGAVGAMTYLGFVNGLGDGRFAPAATLTQEQFIAVMGRLARFLNFHVDDYALALTDEELAVGPIDGIADWARTGAKVLTEYSGNMLCTADVDPHAPVTRGQAAATLCTMLKTLGILVY